MAKLNESKMELTEKDAAEATKAKEASEEEFLTAKDQRSSNVVGMGVGVKWKNGEPTGEPATVVLVTHKLPKDQVNKDDQVPSKLKDMQTDVLAVGQIVAGGGDSPPSPQETGSNTLVRRMRPAEGGYSVGHEDITAGTIGTSVYDILPGGSTNPPQHGVGVPSKYYILSNNHVLANSNNASLGDPILQPGPFDGGVDPADRIATLSRFIPIDFFPAIPLHLHCNVVDAAIAEHVDEDCDRKIYYLGFVRGWRRRTQVLPGNLVQKTGRTTNFTTGRVQVVEATVDVGYGGGRVARFRDQILSTRMGAGGDSGSVWTTYDNVAVGLHFAGSPFVSVANQIENVRFLLRVEVAEQIL